MWMTEKLALLTNGSTRESNIVASEYCGSWQSSHYTLVDHADWPFGEVDVETHALERGSLGFPKPVWALCVFPHSFKICYQF